MSDLEALVKDTHKFESRYLDGLIGPYPERQDLYLERSPIHHLDGFSEPLILFQGSEDTVVQPDQAETMYEAMAARGLPVALVVFAVKATASAARNLSGPCSGDASSTFTAKSSVSRPRRHRTVTIANLPRTAEIILDSRVELP